MVLPELCFTNAFFNLKKKKCHRKVGKFPLEKPTPPPGQFCLLFFCLIGSKVDWFMGTKPSAPISREDYLKV